MDPMILLSAGMISLADYDKKLHLLAGTAISVAAQGMELQPLERCLLGLGAGLAKEARDRGGRGTVDFADVAATAFSCHFQIRF